MNKLVSVKMCHTSKVFAAELACIAISHNFVNLGNFRRLKICKDKKNSFQLLIREASSGDIGTYHMGRDARKHVFGVSDKVSFKPTYSATETS